MTYINSSRHRVALSVGGNQGDVRGTISWAAAQLGTAGMAEIAVSSLFRTPPVDCEPGTPDFINAAITGLWPAGARDLLNACKRLEVAAGRPAEHRRNAARPLDLDIALFGGLMVDEPDLKIPHPEVRGRLFVLIPLAEIVGDWPIPGGGDTVAEALARLAAANPAEHRTISSSRMPVFLSETAGKSQRTQ